MIERKRLVLGSRQPDLMMQPYKCDKCGKIGNVAHWSDDDATEICDGIRQIHLQAERCAGSLQFGERYRGRPTTE